MTNHRPPPAFDGPFDGRSPRLSRRRLLAGSGAAVATTTLVGPGLAQEATPATAVAIDPAAFRAVCVNITGVEDLPDDGLEQLLGLFTADEEMAAGLRELLAMGGDTVEIDTRALDFPALIAVTNILQFWYLGEFKNEPLANRAERFGGLLSWQALPYVTVPAVCKVFGYWASDPGLPDQG